MWLAQSQDYTLVDHQLGGSMAKLCAKGKAAAKRKFKKYPSAYANMYAAGICSGRIKPKKKK